MSSTTHPEDASRLRSHKSSHHRMRVFRFPIYVFAPQLPRPICVRQQPTDTTTRHATARAQLSGVGECAHPKSSPVPVSLLKECLQPAALNQVLTANGLLRKIMVLHESLGFWIRTRGRARERKPKREWPLPSTTQ